MSSKNQWEDLKNIHLVTCFVWNPSFYYVTEYLNKPIQFSIRREMKHAWVPHVVCHRAIQAPKYATTQPCGLSHFVPDIIIIAESHHYVSFIRAAIWFNIASGLSVIGGATHCESSVRKVYNWNPDPTPDYTDFYYKKHSTNRLKEWGLAAWGGGRKCFVRFKIQSIKRTKKGGEWGRKK